MNDSNRQHEDSCGPWDGGGGGSRTKKDWDNFIECPPGTYPGKILRAVNVGWQLPWQEDPKGFCEKQCYLFVEVDEPMPDSQVGDPEPGKPRLTRYVLSEELPLKMNYGLLRSVFEAVFNNNVPEEVKANPRLSHLEGKDLNVVYSMLTYKRDDPRGRWHAGDAKRDKKTGKQRRGITAFTPLMRGQIPMEGPFKTVPADGYGLAKWKIGQAVSDKVAHDWNERAFDLRKQAKGDKPRPGEQGPEPDVTDDQGNPVHVEPHGGEEYPATYGE